MDSSWTRLTALGAALLAVGLGILLVAAPALAHSGKAHDESLTSAREGAGPGRAVTATGSLQRVHGHRMGKRTSMAGWMLATRRGQRIPLALGTRKPPRAGSRVQVSGRRRGTTLHVRQLRRLPGGVTAREAAVPRGAKRTAVILFNFSDNRSQPFTVNEVRNALFTGARSVSSFYAAESHGSLSLTGRDRTDGDIYGWYEIDSSAAQCFGGSSWDWYSKADAAVRAGGGNLSGYDHVVYVHPKVASCGFSGIATLGGDWSDLNGDIGLWVAGHEIGHNYDFEHAGKAYCRNAAGQPVAISDSCTLGEYDDPYDIMGNRFQRHSSAVWQLKAGWIAPANVTTVTSSGAYELSPLAERLSGTQVLRVPGRDGRWYWLEYRRPHGSFDTFALSEPVVNGITIRLADGLAAPGVTELIDTTPSTPGRTRDEALTVGRSFTDAEAGVRITTEQVSSTSARVAVHFGSFTEEVAVSGAGAASDVATPTPTPAPAPRVADAPLAPRRALVNGRSLAVERIARADGRVLTVKSRTTPPPMEVRFLPDSAVLDRASKLTVRWKSPKRCLTSVSVRGPGGRWSRIARVKPPRGLATATLPVAAGRLRPTFDVRLACAGGKRQELSVDAMALSLR